jgi:acyl-CoA synthetase (NDP forming)
MRESIERILEAARTKGRFSLLEHEVYAILAEAGIDVPRHRFWTGAPGAALPDEIRRFLADLPSDDAVLKIVSPQILHKTDVGGLAFCRRDPDAVLERARGIWQETGRRVPGADRRGILVLEKVPARSVGLASELLLSVKQDPSFGSVIVLGLGGVLTEWYGRFSFGTSTAIFTPGAVREGIQQLISELPALGLLFRPSRLHAEPPLDLERTAAHCEALGRIAIEFGPARDGARSEFTIEELEMNPMLLTADGRWVAVDGVGRFSTAKVNRPHRPLRKIKNLLEPKSAVVLGASGKGMNPGRIILRNLKAGEGPTYGHVYAVHPKDEAIDGIPCLRRLEDLPEKVDLAVVAIPAEGARDSIREICEKDLASSIILIPGGFAETGREGLETEIIGALEASRAHEGGGPVLVGGNCLGIVSKRQYNTFFLPQYKLPFHDAPGDRFVAVSQSGAYLVSLTSNLDGIIFPRASISYGNQMDLTVSDFLEYLLGEDDVKVIACYVEGFKPLDGDRFLKLARELRERGKRVIAFKSGKTALGAMAARSHTASLAGDYAVARCLMYQAGIVVADTLNMFEDYAKVFTMLWDRIPAGGARRGETMSGPSWGTHAHSEGGAEVGRRVGIISNAGFECTSVLDRLFNLKLGALTEKTRARLAEVLPGIAHADNPIDATPMAGTPEFIAAAEAMLEDPNVDALLISPVPVTPALDNLAPDLAGRHSENIFGSRSLPAEIIRLFGNTTKPIAVSVDSGRLYDDFVIMLQRNGIPTYRKIDRASRALSALLAL